MNKCHFLLSKYHHKFACVECYVHDYLRSASHTNITRAEDADSFIGLSLDSARRVVFARRVSTIARVAYPNLLSPSYPTLKSSRVRHSATESEGREQGWTGIHGTCDNYITTVCAKQQQIRSIIEGPPFLDNIAHTSCTLFTIIHREMHKQTNQQCRWFPSLASRYPEQCLNLTSKVTPGRDVTSSQFLSAHWPDNKIVTSSICLYIRRSPNDRFFYTIIIQYNFLRFLRVGMKGHNIINSENLVQCYQTNTPNTASNGSRSGARIPWNLTT